MIWIEVIKKLRSKLAISKDKMCAIGLAPNLIITVKENKSDDRGSEKTFEMQFLFI
jgi:hypothetical protein